MIVIDSFEKEDVRVEQYLHAKGLKTRREPLSFNGVQCGDYTNDGYDFLVERKSWKDYYGSLLDKSLQKQMVKMAENFSGPKYLMFEGDFDAMLSTISKPSIKHWAESYVLRLQHVYGIAFVKCYDPSECADFLVLLDRYTSSLTKDDNPWKGSHTKKTLDLRARPLLTVPRLGSDGVNNLLKEYKNVVKVIEACVDSSTKVAKKVDRVGKTSAEKIAEIFTSKKPVIDKKVAKKQKMSDSQKSYADNKRKAVYRRKNNTYERNKKK